MRDSSRAVLLIMLVGVLTFGVVFSFLEFSPSRAEPAEVSPTAEETPTTVMPVATDSLAPRIGAGNVAVGVPIGGSEALLRNVQAGDRLDIVASIASPADARPLTAVVVRAATVLKPINGVDPLVVQVAAPDAVMLAHLVMNGTRLGYVLWPAGASMPGGTPPPLDDRSVRDALGLGSATATPLPAATASTVAVATPTPTGPGSGFLYQVQPGDSWDGIAGIFGVSADELRRWNEAGAQDPVPGSLVFIPRQS